MTKLSPLLLMSLLLTHPAQAQTTAVQLEDMKKLCPDAPAGMAMKYCRHAAFYEAYRPLAHRFNRELAGRYPFAALGERDASPDALKAYLVDYLAQREHLRGLLETNEKRFKAARQFLGQMDAVAAFFRSNLAQTPDSAPLKLRVHFNTLPALSRGANQIVSWSLSSSSLSAGYPNRRTTLDWAWGQAVELQLTWANHSLWRPLADPAQTDLAVDGATASFSAAGPWALLRLIHTHRPNPAPAPNLLGRGPIPTVYRLPLIGRGADAGTFKRGQARVHVSLELSDPTSSAPLALPVTFPTSAPID